MQCVPREKRTESQDIGQNVSKLGLNYNQPHYSPDLILLADRQLCVLDHPSNQILLPKTTILMNFSAPRL